MVIKLVYTTVAELITTNVRNIEANCWTSPEAFARGKLLSKSYLVDIRIFCIILLPTPTVMVIVYRLFL